jgi:hypothetical protein
MEPCLGRPIGERPFWDTRKEGWVGSEKENEAILGCRKESNSKRYFAL